MKFLSYSKKGLYSNSLIAWLLSVRSTPLLNWGKTWMNRPMHQNLCALKPLLDIRRSAKKMFEMKSWPTSSTSVTPSPNVQSALIYPYLIEVKDQGLFFFPRVKEKPLQTGRQLEKSVSAMDWTFATVFWTSNFVT